MGMGSGLSPEKVTHNIGMAVDDLPTGDFIMKLYVSATYNFNHIFACILVEIIYV